MLIIFVISGNYFLLWAVQIAQLAHTSDTTAVQDWIKGQKDMRVRDLEAAMTNQIGRKGTVRKLERIEKGGV